MQLWLLLPVLPILIMSIVLHEVAHGWVALWFGDTTARDAGRLTLNPLAHIDLFGSVILPIICVLLKIPIFAWAKPVPVDFLRLDRKAVLCVSLAGVAVNFVLAAAGALVLRLWWVPGGTSPVALLLELAIWINLLLGVFNLLPIPPLDGWRIWGEWLPLKWQMVIEMNALIFLLILILFLPYLPIMRIVNTLFVILVSK